MRRGNVTWALATGLTLLLAATPASAAHHEGEKSDVSDRQPWNQERMTELSRQLAQATSELRRAFLREPSFRNPKTPNQRRLHQLQQTLRNLEIAARRLDRQVSGGGDYDDTSGTARRIGLLLNDADVAGRGVMTSAFMAEKIRPAMELINEIAPYYGSGPLYDPETMQRLDRPPNPDRPGAQQ